MADPAPQEASHGDVDHGPGNVEALLVVAYQPSPPGEPAEGSLDYPTSRQHLEAGLGVDASDDLDDEVEKCGLVHELRAVIGAVGEQVLDPGPALADRVEDQLSAGAVGHVGRRQIDHQEAPVGVHRDVALAPDRLLGGVVAPLRPRRWGLHRLAVYHARTRTGLTAGAFSVHHQRDIVDRAEQHQPNKATKPPIDCLPRREVLRQHPPAAARARHVADRVQDLAHVNVRLASALRRLRQQRRDPRPFFVGEIGRVTLRLPLDRGHAASRLSCPHP